MKNILPLFCLLTIGIPSVKAAVIITNDSQSTFTVSNTDLLQTALSSTTTANDWNVARAGTLMTGPQATAFNNSGVPQGEPTLHNGIWENYTVPFGTGIGGAATGNGYVVSYGLNLAASPLGYSINQIDLYSNWAGTSRDDIRVTIDYALIGTPTTFDQIIVTDQFYAPITTGKGKMSISLTGTDIATGVAAIRFTFPSQENSGVGYSEIDVFGAAIPEPSSALLLGLSAVGMLLLRRRRHV